VVNIGNGLGQSLFLTITLSSGQEEWFASPDSHSFEAQSCEQFQRMVHFGDWCRIVISFGNGLDSHSLGKIHSLYTALPRADSFSLGFTFFSVGGMAQIGNGPAS
jgi:hypothetical protein